MINTESNLIKKRIESLKRNIKEIAQNCGRNDQDIKIMAVTKGVDPSLILEVYKEGIDLFGESYFQEASKKLDYLYDNSHLNKKNFHFIGHLQKNKTSKAISYFSSIDSIDSIELCELISRKASKNNITVDVMIEVKTSYEETKYGLFPEDINNIVSNLIKLPNINLIGVMTIAPLKATQDLIRDCFRRLFKVWEEINKLYNLKLPYISMGMSDDYKIAIEEGSTMLRIGRAIFGRS
ncbi:MAG: YggS family pyridoxal phosphate-dependent enzyme [Caldisericia bacterium]|jgi:hypothetical protein|nr:YggS family pyridoxal phosphate-dependent enzyme [Caldisericia bacterium]MDD3427784.1 YggS family pyridoxal phosphate-dependent enzyme [Caldisericia bacterium]MDD5689211.1 YggS family pyridoxal phosphate-dependent enzyme [Caldisericia bacterium]HOJ16136.1 YggS family pyridoxal phosphate-dependent enzyme [Caldisericia bacterium]HOW02803.1 YggS family pyridoxal phosphate-dependent enzyme [Caldisericia bacterium]